ncbi:class IIb bacteriocin, lactobin A/cerein 7B family, partial [Streptococcus suis]|uniref:class IIb bacteriocin, lactobin A/cerein 7B family n=2 Tax=Streptococcus TaxID=1301 RepID=UPI00396F5867
MDLVCTWDQNRRLKMNNFVDMKQEELENINGGFVVTGTMIYTGVKLASASFAL